MLLILVMLLSTSASADNTKLLQVLASDNHFALMRHALAPGTGDPLNFELGDCSTQRNLDDTGRHQAKNIGGVLRASALSGLAVYSSQWCRCVETAELLNLGPVTELPRINSFYSTRSRAAEQTDATRDWLRTATLPVILVTHQVNITALTGIFPSSGEIVVVKREENGEFSVVGSIDL